jgi:hypothetical protein
MQFCLRYSGRLKSSDTAVGKHAIRSALHEQVKSLCASEAFAPAFAANEKDVREERGEPLYVTHGSKRFWFLVSESHATVVDLRVTLLVPHKVRGIVHNGGDIDNRIKTLLDALRAPASPSEIPTVDRFDYSGDGMYCLLQDDKLVNRLAIQTYQDHAPADTDAVTALIEVETRITRALWGNIHFV